MTSLENDPSEKVRIQAAENLSKVDPIKKKSFEADAIKILKNVFLTEQDKYNSKLLPELINALAHHNEKTILVYLMAMQGNTDYLPETQQAIDKAIEKLSRPTTEKNPPTKKKTEFKLEPSDVEKMLD